MSERRPARDWAAQADVWAAEALAAGDPTGWFERLYAAASAGEVTMPWDHADAHPFLPAMLAEARRRRTRSLEGARQRRLETAVVVGCGLGGDAEHVSGAGWATTAFDISPSAIRLAQARNPGSRVTYSVTDLFTPPREFLGAFDLVVEIHTVQALPRSLRLRAVQSVARLVAPGGTLLVIAAADAGGPTPDGPPWPLTRTQLDWFRAAGLAELAVERVDHAGTRMWRAAYLNPRPR